MDRRLSWGMSREHVEEFPRELSGDCPRVNIRSMSFGEFIGKEVWRRMS